MKTKLLLFLIFTFAFLVFADQNPLDRTKPYKMNPRGIIQKPIEKVKPQRHISSQRVIKPQNQRSDACDEGYADYCSGDGDCCPNSWIGDGFPDCEDQFYDYDLTCYDCDGGDCPETDPGCSEPNDCCSPGDYNCDYSINVLDIVAIVNCILDDADCTCGDLSGDDTVNVLDIVQLVNMILGS